MIGVLFRRDPALRGVVLASLGAALLTWVHGRATWLLDVDLTAASVSADAVRVPLIPLGALFVMLLVANGGLRDRLGEFQLALPVSARVWIGVRIAALTALAWIPLAVVALLLPLVFEAVLVAPLLRGIGAFALVWAAWIAASFAIRPAERRAPVLGLVATSASALVAASITQVEPAAGAGAAAVALAVSLAVLARGVPRSLRAESTAERTRRGWIAKAAWQLPGSAPLARWIAGATVLRVSAAIHLLGLVLIGAAVFGTGTSGAFFAVILPVSVYAFVTRAAEVLGSVGHLPIERRRVAPWVLVPPAVALLFALALGEWMASADTEPSYRASVDLVASPGAARGAEQHVRVPAQLERLVLGREPIPVTSPAGEVVHIAPRPLLPGLPLAVWNPYGTEDKSSIDFVAWQLARALHAAYGATIEPAELAERYLGVQGDKVIGPFFHERLLEDLPELRLARPASTPWTGAILAALLWAGAAAYALRAPVPAADPRRWRGGHVARLALDGSLVLLALVYLAGPWLERATGAHRPDLRLLAAGVLERNVPGALLPVAAAATFALAWMLLRRRFERFEISRGRTDPSVGG